MHAGIPKNAIVNPNAEVSREQIIKEKASRRTKDGKKKEAPSHLTAPVNTSKNTLGHNAVVEARDMAYQVSKQEHTRPQCSGGSRGYGLSGE